MIPGTFFFFFSKLKFCRTMFKTRLYLTVRKYTWMPEGVQPKFSTAIKHSPYSLLYPSQRPSISSFHPFFLKELFFKRKFIKVRTIFFLQVSPTDHFLLGMLLQGALLWERVFPTYPSLMNGPSHFLILTGNMWVESIANGTVRQNCGRLINTAPKQVSKLFVLYLIDMQIIN